MADVEYKKIGEFNAVQTLNDTDRFLLSRSGITYNVTGAFIKQLCLSGSAEIRNVGGVDYWFIYDKQTGQMVQSIQARGEKGDTGDRGTDGEDAPTITDIAIDSNYHLIITLSNGDSYDAGYCRGASGSGTGDMLAEDYDPNENVFSAGGIEDFVSNEVQDIHDAYDADSVVRDAGGIVNYTSDNYSVKPINFTKTLSSSGWSKASGQNYYTQTVTLSGVTLTSLSNVIISFSASNTSAQLEEIAKCQVMAVSNDSTHITFACKKDDIYPSENISVEILVMG